MSESVASRRIAYVRVCKTMVLLSMLAALFYLKWLLFDARPDNHVLFVMLIAAELFNVFQAMGFWYTIYRQEWVQPRKPRFSRSAETVDIFITVYGEPADVVQRTLDGALAVRHPRKRVWILDDGPSHEIEMIAVLRGAGYLTRDDRDGAKAGNVNAALARTVGDFIVIFDADHVPHPEFLERTMGAFAAPSIGFVQTPQSYGNRDENRVSAGAHEQLDIFYGPIMRGRTVRGAVFSCGTNVVFRREALRAAGGMPEDSITEDLRVSLLLLDEGYSAVYVPEVLAEGIGPVDVAGYFSQQSRWARGGLEILFKRRPFSVKMPFAARIEYGLSFMYWFTGFAYGIYLILPVAYLLFGLRPVQVPNLYPAYFMPYLVTTLMTLVYATEFRITFRALWFTLGSFPVHIGALLRALFGKRATFVVTAKSGANRSLRPVMVHVFFIALLAYSIVFGIWVGGLTPSVANNVAFALGHILVLSGFVRYALRPEARAGVDYNASMRKEVADEAA